VVLRQYATVKLVIAGVGRDEQKIRTRIEEKRLTQSIFLEPGDEHRFSYFKSADVFLSTSPDGIDSDMLLEVAAAGLPMLAVNVHSAAEFIENEQTGLVCGVGDLNCFMRGVNAYLNNVEMRVRCGKNASERVDTLIKSDLVNHQRLYRENIERTIISYLERSDPGEAARREDA
jgi:L-malate glycosyltransferase